MSKATRPTKMLEKAVIRFTLHSYEYQPDADRIGLQAAEALHEQGWQLRQMVLPSTEYGKSDSMVAILERVID